MGRAENAIQVIVARASLMLTRKSGRSCGSAEDRHSAQTRPGRHKSTGEPLVFHHLPENGHTEAKSGNAMSAARHRRGPAQGRSNVMVGIETSDLHGIGRSWGSRRSQMSGESTTAACQIMSQIPCSFAVLERSARWCGCDWRAESSARKRSARFGPQYNKGERKAT
jgi:hypothetical protein